MIKTLYAFVCSLAVSLLLISSEVVATEEVQAESVEKIKVLVWGDSLSAAYGIPVDKGWVSLLQEQYKDELDVVNASISGETTQGGLSRLPDALESHKPTLLLLELGANDGLRGIQTETMQENLQQMIVMSQEAGAKVVLLGIRIPLNYGFTYTQKFEKVYVDLAEQYDLPLLPFLLETVALDYGLMQSDSGSISVMQNDITKLDQKALDILRADIGFLFQGSALYDSMTVRENLEFPLRRHTKRFDNEITTEALVIEALESVGLADAIDLMPSELSGGMKKRVALARALILKPKIMLYDEPTSGLDPITAKEIILLMQKIQKQYGTSSLIITHDIDCARV